jgi:hypothetical protein
MANFDGILTLKSMDNAMKKMGFLSSVEYTPEEADEVLTANRFLFDEDIENIIEFASNVAYTEMYATREKYASRIWSLIEPSDALGTKLVKNGEKVVKTKVVDLTDELMEKLDIERKRAKIAEFEKIWAVEKDKYERPEGDIDAELDDAWNLLQDAMDKLQNYINSQKRFYVAPSARGRKNPEQEKLESNLAKVRSEFEAIQKRIEIADEEYLATKKDELFKEMLGMQT